MQQEHRRLIAALKRERARRKALGARARFRFQHAAATQRMQENRRSMKERARQAREKAQQARRRAEQRRRNVRR